jgi:hypothetical protein
MAFAGAAAEPQALLVLNCADLFAVHGVQGCKARFSADAANSKLLRPPAFKLSWLAAD